MAMPMGRRSAKGQSSVKKMAMPIEIGTATSMAIADVTIVP